VQGAGQCRRWQRSSFCYQFSQRRALVRARLVNGTYIGDRSQRLDADRCHGRWRALTMVTSIFRVSSVRCRICDVLRLSAQAMASLARHRSRQRTTQITARTLLSAFRPPAATRSTRTTIRLRWWPQHRSRQAARLLWRAANRAISGTPAAGGRVER
jgi:hypothetical protein